MQTTNLLIDHKYENKLHENSYAEIFFLTKITRCAAHRLRYSGKRIIQTRDALHHT